MTSTISSSNITARGRAAPLGTTVSYEGVNFRFFSREASAVELLLFDREDDARPTCLVSIDPVANRTYHYWHVFVPGISRRTTLRRVGSRSVVVLWTSHRTRTRNETDYATVKYPTTTDSPDSGRL
jgi:pullulanase/glycogen debranching enzyme